ncbi:hypothetical protein [Dongia sp.]|uniref:hypothetical protein n=1 Tax=Dongia sp. TaxID=1977262 RepID=UPI0037532B00
MSNTVVYQEDWEVKLQERLDHPLTWKEVCKVTYTDTKVLHNPYLSTEPAVQAGTRGTAYSFQDFAETDESISIDVYKELPIYIDDADLAQSTYTKQMEMADLQGTLVNEAIEAYVLAQHAAWTNIGDDGNGNIVSGSTTAITVSPTNIDDIIRGLKRIIRKANGHRKAGRNGIFIVWRPEDFEILEAFVQANGFSTADQALKNGTDVGMPYMGVYHYYSNDLTAGHLFAGVRNLFNVGICKSTFGKVTKVIHPAGSSGGNLSGIGMHTRVDMKTKAWAKDATLIYDINVA